MPDRCINLRPWEAAAQPAASVIVRPFKVQPPPKAEVEVMPFRDLNADRYPLWAGWWQDWYRGFQWTEKAPIASGDRAILREAWRLFSNDGGIWIEYRVGDWCRELTAIEEGIVSDLQAGTWRTPQTMPAALARWRREVLGVEARMVREVDIATWMRAGYQAMESIVPGVLRHPVGEAEEDWIRTHGPGSWEQDWCWVIGLEVEP